MSPDSIRTVLTEIAREELKWSGELPSAELASALDSVQRLELVVAVEDRFRICFDAADEERIRTVDDLVREIGSKLDDAAKA